MDILGLKNEINSKKLKNLYIFTGEEKGMMNIYLNKIDSNYIVVDTFDSIVPKLLSASLFNPKCTYVIKNDKAVDDLDTTMLTSMIGKNRVIFIVDSIDGRKTFYKKMKEHIVTFDKLTIEQLVPFITQRCPISNELAVIVAVRCNLDILKIEFECNKISNLNKEVDLQLLNELIIPNPEDVIFDLTKAVALKDSESSFEYLEDLLFRGESAIKILGLLYRNFRNILLVQGYKDMQNREIAAKTKLVIGVVYHIRDIINHFTLDQLIKILQVIQETDINVKSGKEDANTAVRRVLCEILR